MTELVEYCIECATMALLNAKTYFIESLKREGPEARGKVAEFVREVKHAEEHLTEKHPDLASEVRSFRKTFEDCLFSKDVSSCLVEKVDALPALESLTNKVIEKGLE